MNLKGLKGFKGVSTIGLLLVAIFVIAISSFVVFAVHSLTSATVTTEGTGANAANVSGGQRLETLNFSFTTGGNGNLTNVSINFSVIGNNAGNFTVPATNASVICGGLATSLVGWVSQIDATVVRCYNVTQDTGARSAFNVSIVNRTNGVYAPLASGNYLFNITTRDNDTETNTTTVTVQVDRLSANVTINVTTMEIGKNLSLRFTIVNNETADRSIDRIIINFTTAGFTVPVAVSCPGLGNGGNGWGAATIGANDVTCSQGSGNALGTGATTTIILNGTQAGQTAGVQNWDVIVYDTALGPGANYTIAKNTNTSVTTVFGLLNITGTNLNPSTIFINTNGTNNGTNAIRLNFSTRGGEQMNITMITLLRTGTAANADIEEVAIYNGTQNATGGVFVDISNATLIAKNTSAPDSLGRYVFSGIGFNVSAITDNFILVVYNVSRSATGGRTVGFMINNTGNVSVTGGISGGSITPAIVTTASNNATIVGNLTITGIDDLAAAVSQGATNVSVMRFNFSASGEQMNVTQIVLTRMGTATDADVPAVAIYNSSSDGPNVFTANATLIAWNASAPDSLGRYTFAVGFNVSTSGNRLLVVINTSSTAVTSRTIGFMINGTGNVSTTSAVSNQAITETLVTTSTKNATISNFTITGTDTAPSLIFINKNGTNNGTQFIRFNLSTRGEGVNITGITILRTGTAANADIEEVAIYNATPASASSVDTLTAVQLIAKNTSAPDSLGRYTFSGFQWNISGSGDSVDQYLFVVANVSRSATGGRTAGFMINNTGNVTTTGAVSGLAITETLITTASNNATIIGNITITGTSDVPSAITVGATNVSVIRFTFDASAEQMNVTQIVLTRMGTATDSDVPAVAIYNSSSDGANVFTANATLIAWNASAPDSLGRYTFAVVGLNVSATTDNVLLVVANISSTAVASRTVGFMINGTGNVSTTSAVSGQAITETLVTTSTSVNSTLGNLTITGTNTAPSTILINTNGTDNGTQFVRFNFSTRGEGVNISSITILRTGTAANADILEVAIYNATPVSASSVDTLTAVTLRAKNTSAPDSLGRYTFTGLNWNISGSADSVDQYLFVVANVSRAATGGRTIGFMINNTGNVTATGAVSAQGTSEFLLTGASNNATIVGNITVTGTSDVPSAITVGANNVSIIRYTFDSSGEQMNVTQIVLTRMGTATDSDVPAVAIYNSSSDGANVFTANATLIAWNTSAPDSLGRYTFSVGLNVSAATDNVLLVVANISSTAVATRTVGFMINGTGNVSTTSSVSGQAITETLVTTSTSVNSTLGNLTITGTNTAPGTIIINTNGTNNGTQFIRFNFSTRGEGVNITSITILRTGTATDVDIFEVALYNATPAADSDIDPLTNVQLIAKNTSAPDSLGRYTFSGFQWNISNSGDSVDQYLFVVANLTRNATGGRTLGFMINNTGNVTATGAVSAQGTSEFLLTGASNNATIVGNITVTGTNDMPSTVPLTARNVSVIRFNFAPAGEQMNITAINISRTGTTTDADVIAVGLYNSSSDGANVFTANATLIAWNSSAPANGVYNFSGLTFNVPTSGNQLLVVVNISAIATGGRTLGFTINSATNITTTSAVSGQSIIETLVTEASNNATIVGNLTVTGANTAPGTIIINTNGTDNGTQFVRFNFSTRGEGMNITEINITRTGTAQDGDIIEVAIYNATPASASSVDTLTAVQLIAKNTSVPRADGTYTFRNFQWNISGSADSVDQYLFIVANISRGATGGRTVGFMINSAGNVSTTSRITGQSVVEHPLTATSNNATIVGNLTITGTTATPTLVTINTTNASVIRFTFDASAEQMNVTQIVLTRTGTATTADIPAIALYNSSSDGANVFTANATLIAWNTSAPDSLGRYTFAVGVNVSAATDNVLLVVINTSATSTVGLTVGFMINGTGNVSTTSAVSNQAITETLVTEASNNGTLVGNLTIAGGSPISTVAVGSRNSTVTTYLFLAAGEQMNITEINLTRTGTVADSEVESVAIYNTSATDDDVFNGTETLIASNSSAPRADGTYNFTNIVFNVPVSDSKLLVVVNFTAGSTTTGGKTIGFKISPAANVTTNSSVTNQAITETLITTASANVTIYGNLTITGTSQIPSTVGVGSRSITVTSYNFSAIAEQMNITGINLTLTGTVSTADIESVSIYNGTVTTFAAASVTMIAQNTSAPRADGTYVLSGIGFNVTASDTLGNVLLVVVNFTAGSTTSGGKTLGFKISPAANATVTGAVSSAAITPILITTSSANATVVGNLTVSGGDVSANVKINQKRVTFLNLSFLARGEQVNVTNINLTLGGNASFANVSEIRLFNDGGSATGTLDGSDTVIAGTATAPSSGRVTITPTSAIALTPSTAKIIFVVLNVSDESDAGGIVGVQINSTDVAALANTTAHPLSTNWSTVTTANRTIQSNIGQKVVGAVTGWYTLDVPHQTILESIGRTAGTTQNFNISKILYSLRTNYRFVYYNTDGTSSGWKLFDRTDWAGSSLQYANNTNDKVYWINMTAEDTFEL